jgi:hypothetical protein
MVEKPPPSPQKYYWKIKKRVKINTRPPAKICESVTLTKFFFYMA